MADRPLDSDEIRRYARHLVLGEVGLEGQERLKGTRILVVGAGGLGSPAALYLAAAGVGTLGLLDSDVVELSNLQRQVIHGTPDVGRGKSASASDRVAALNPHVLVEAYPVRLDPGNAADILPRYDVVVDGSDNFPTRYLVNDACVRFGIPLVYGSILRWEGQVSLFADPRGGADGGAGPCYRCLFREPPPAELVPSCAEAGVFGALPGVIGSMQALEAIKRVLGVGHGLSGRLLLFDALEASWREVRLRRDPECPACGDAPSIGELSMYDYEGFCGLSTEAESGEGDEPPRGTGSPGTPAAGTGARVGPTDGDFPPRVTPEELEALLAGDEPPLIVDVREGWEWGEGNLAARGAIHLPLAALEGALPTLPRDRPVVAVCSMGARSAGAADYLRARGFSRVANLVGGLAAWASVIDPELRVV
jgi:adenylyltransferase/sulfurtransferase